MSLYYNLQKVKEIIKTNSHYHLIKSYTKGVSQHGGFMLGLWPFRKLTRMKKLSQHETLLKLPNWTLLISSIQIWSLPGRAGFLDFCVCPVGSVESSEWAPGLANSCVLSVQVVSCPWHLVKVNSIMNRWRGKIPALPHSQRNHCWVLFGVRVFSFVFYFQKVSSAHERFWVLSSDNATGGSSDSLQNFLKVEFCLFW